MKHIRKTDPNLVDLISDLKRETREGEAGIWRDIAQRLEKPSRTWAEVNLSRLERYAQDGDIVVVPGKVLGAGSINKKVTVADQTQVLRFGRQGHRRGGGQADDHT